jgi:Tfp pilus assembly protein PilF
MPRLPGTILAAIALLLSGAAWRGSTPSGEPLQTPSEVGNEACAPCHKSIYDSYAATAMARTSGPALPNVIEGSFDHAPSGIAYRIQRQGELALFSYNRPGSRILGGTQRLKYFLGSNTRGRTFLFEIDGFLYQLPINYYAGKHQWDMAPGYSQVREMPLNRPADSTCLFCHASRVQRPAQGTLNRHQGEAFLQSGVGCERCHGPGSAHVKGLGPMVNPAKLTGERRDSVCVQCHLEGEGRIATAGRTQDEYLPGDTLSTYLAIFVRDDAATGRLGAVTHVEALEVSLCRRASGGELSCITCHDPHVQPEAADKAGYYRERCLGCHAPLATTHHPDRRDCTSCHMPRMASADIGHTMVTDHRIVRTERRDAPKAASVGRLVEFGSRQSRARELGLAYGEVALRGNTFAAREALRLLEQVLPAHPGDPDVLTRLGYLYQMQGDLDRAERLYERALKEDPTRAVVAANLGVFYAGRSMLRRALDLWDTAFEKNPQLSEAGLNLANGLCAAGDSSGAEQAVRRVLTHNPDSGAARTLLADVTGGRCSRK